MTPKPENNKPGIITSIFDINGDGKLDIVEEALLFSAVEDALSEENKIITKPQPKKKVVDLDDLNIKGI